MSHPQPTAYFISQIFVLSFSDSQPYSTNRLNISEWLYIFLGTLWEHTYLLTFSSCTVMHFSEVIGKSHADTSIPKEYKLIYLIYTSILKNHHKGTVQRI